MPDGEPVQAGDLSPGDKVLVEYTSHFNEDVLGYVLVEVDEAVEEGPGSKPTLYTSGQDYEWEVNETHIIRIDDNDDIVYGDDPEVSVLQEVAL